ncbi:MAG: glycosyltransferase family 4 protein [Akkermansiaceae bacterium]|jgi:glycosyltransferase involved in cell wall biosynthesis|nr:glycosyltransferase family 4 protein [Akkermansiaceae bacterium]
MKVVQILPELNSGGVERGTLEVAAHLVRQGHEAIVISHGGRLVEKLEISGARHFAMPVHRKSITTLRYVRALRSLLTELNPDIVHVRSRVPAWIAWLAWRRMDPAKRPRFVSTVHGFYSVNAYSKIMTRGERVIAVSNSVRDYIIKNYPATAQDHIRVIHRGASPQEFPRGHRPEEGWLTEWRRNHPQLEGKKILLLPGRITRWKGHDHFIELIAQLRKRGLAVHGLVLGETHPRKQAYAVELKARCAEMGVAEDITFLGHRSDVRDVMAVADVVFSLSLEPEAFGRVSLEAASLGRPVIGYAHGGVAEQLEVLYPQGLVPVGDVPQLVETTIAVLQHPGEPAEVRPPFTLEAMCQATEAVYQELLRP